MAENDVFHIASPTSSSLSPIYDYVTESPVLKAFLAGSLSGTCSAILFQPLELVKTRLQADTDLRASSPKTKASISSMIQMVSQIVRNENLFTLWRGLSPSIVRCVPGVGLYFSSMHYMVTKYADGHPSPVEAMLIGVSARTLSAAVLIPLTVIKTRFESGEYEYKGLKHGLRMIYQKEGIRGLSCGLLPTIVRDAPFSGLYLMFYSQIKSHINSNCKNEVNQIPVPFISGVFAGILASLITQPADVLKTKMQLYPEKFHNVLDVMLYVQKTYGLKGFMKGLVPRMLRRTLMASMAWTVYEHITVSIGLK
ncbi:unnamed protein product [Bemisia tabaci]|uniref:Mitochondrial glycine transporter n=1 Tax=Bemisia tabaci TaxID=7038 RepID=A0A9P0AD88_BEMTA|nr:unnamed protein product [Bemisia tabaci]